MSAMLAALQEAIYYGSITIARINQSVSRILELKARFGLIHVLQLPSVSTYGAILSRWPPPSIPPIAHASAAPATFRVAAHPSHQLPFIPAGSDLPHRQCLALFDQRASQHYHGNECAKYLRGSGYQTHGPTIWTRRVHAMQPGCHLGHISGEKSDFQPDLSGKAWSVPLTQMPMPVGRLRSVRGQFRDANFRRRSATPSA